MTIVFVPGLACDARIYDAQARAFPDSLVIDGFGRTDSIKAMSEHVLDVAPERFSLFGHSMGGRVALEIYRAAPERVERLALVSTGVHDVRPGELEKRQQLLSVGRKNGFDALIEAWLPPMIGKSNQQNAKLVSALRDMCVSAGLEAFEAQVTALLSRPNAREVLSRIACPTLVMTGNEDNWSPALQHQKIAAEISDARLRIIDGAGHMLMREAPDAVNEAITEWLT